ncbi:MAG: gliding motility protein GldL [Prevotella sp.]|nr:gliding motility protein GldL [Prevotella sp.]
MTKYSKFNPIYRLQKWLDSVPGQTFMNYAYSWGASIVILGALFKLTHLPGANFMLFLGMGTEVLVFFIAGFDRPFDKTEDGKDLPTHVVRDDVGDEAAEAQEEGEQPAVAAVAGGMGYGGTVIIGGGAAASAGAAGASEGEPLAGNAAMGGATIVGGIVQPELPDIDPEEMENATQNYVEELKNLTEMLKKVSEQSQRLTRDSEEMENLNRTLTGICKVYEMQLKGASQQIGTIDEINEQTRKMSNQIAELNRIYARMIEAMTVNMKNVE